MFLTQDVFVFRTLIEELPTCPMEQLVHLVFTGEDRDKRVCLLLPPATPTEDLPPLRGLLVRDRWVTGTCDAVVV